MKKAAEAKSFRRAARRKKSCKAGLLSFLCIDIYVIEKEDSNERNPSGVSFVFVQVGLAENEVFCRAEKRRKQKASAAKRPARYQLMYSYGTVK